MMRGGHEDTMTMSHEDLRARFDAEMRSAGLTIVGRDRELLFAMWAEHLPQREALRAAVPALDEEPDA
jgi:hypothetical protein